MLKHYYYDLRWLYCDGKPELLFTDNETNHRRFDETMPETGSAYFKDGINNYIVHGNKETVNPRHSDAVTAPIVVDGSPDNVQPDGCT